MSFTVELVTLWNWFAFRWAFCEWTLLCVSLKREPFSLYLICANHVWMFGVEEPRP